MTDLRPDHRAWIISWTYQWLDAVGRQARRVEEAPDTGSGQVEILLFAVALRNVLRGSELILGRGHVAVRSFHDAVPGATDVRDQLEHFDDYVRGRGRAQTEKSPEWLVYYSSTSQTGGERSIHINHHTLEVQSAADAAITLAAAAINHPSITPVSEAEEGAQR